MKKAIIFIEVLVISCILLSMTPARYQKLLGVGINVNWVNFKKVRISFLNAYEKGISIPELFKDRGFSHVRIRVNDGVLKDRGVLKALDIAVDESLKAGLIPIIAYSAKSFINNPDDPEAMEDAINFWKSIAERYKSRSKLLSYDLIIETGKKIKDRPDKLNEFYRRVVPVIRSIDEERIIFITPCHASHPDCLPELWLPKDDYVMVQWHFYAGGPSRKNPRKKWTTGTDE